MSLNQPYDQQVFMGMHADDATALIYIQDQKWDSTKDGAGTPESGMTYYNSTDNAIKQYNGTIWAKIIDSRTRFIAPPKTFYIDVASTETLETGSMAYPYKTIQAAIDQASTNADGSIANPYYLLAAAGDYSAEGVLDFGKVTLEAIYLIAKHSQEFPLNTKIKGFKSIVNNDASRVLVVQGFIILGAGAEVTVTGASDGTLAYTTIFQMLDCNVNAPTIITNVFAFVFDNCAFQDDFTTNNVGNGNVYKGRGFLSSSKDITVNWDDTAFKPFFTTQARLFLTNTEVVAGEVNCVKVAGPGGNAGVILEDCYTNIATKLDCKHVGGYVEFKGGSLICPDIDIDDGIGGGATFTINMTKWDPFYLTKGGGTVTSSLLVVDRAEGVADDGEIIAPTVITGWGVVMAGDNEEYAYFRFKSDGTVTLQSTSANVVNTDTDGNLCIYDKGTGIAIKNRLGALKEIRYELKYSY